jgi:hypothetical protein
MGWLAAHVVQLLVLAALGIWRLRSGDRMRRRIGVVFICAAAMTLAVIAMDVRTIRVEKQTKALRQRQPVFHQVI